MSTVLLIEDEEDITELISYHAQKEGYKISAVGSGEDAITHLTSEELPDLILLDLMLPGMTGIDICRTLKANPKWVHIPVIMVSAKNEESDVVRGLEIGAEDYIEKPFSPKVLMVRIKKVLDRQTEQVTENEKKIKIVGDLKIDTIKREVKYKNKKIDLTYSEFQALEKMAEKPGWVFTRIQIVQAIHGNSYITTDRTVDVMIVGIRKKLGEGSSIIETVRGVGYRIKE